MVHGLKISVFLKVYPFQLSTPCWHHKFNFSRISCWWCLLCCCKYRLVHPLSTKYLKECCSPLCSHMITVQFWYLINFSISICINNVGQIQESLRTNQQTSHWVTFKRMILFLNTLQVKWQNRKIAFTSFFKYILNPWAPQSSIPIMHWIHPSWTKKGT